MSARSIVIACLCVAASGLATHGLHAAENKAKVRMQDFHFTKKMDKASPKLTTAPTLSGPEAVSPGNGGVAGVTDIAKDKPKAPPPPPPPTTGGIGLSDVLISTYRSSSPGAPATQPPGTGSESLAKIRPSDIPIIKPVDKSSPGLPMAAPAGAATSPLKSLRSLGSANDLFVNRTTGVPTGPLPGAAKAVTAVPVRPLGEKPVAVPGNPGGKGGATPPAASTGAAVKPAGVAMPSRVDAPKAPLGLPSGGTGKLGAPAAAPAPAVGGPTLNLKGKVAR